jgi:hypothetical protein
MDEEETIYLVEFGSGKKQYVLAPDEKSAHVVLKRMYRAPRYDFDLEDYEITDTGSTDVEGAARGNDPPFSVLEARRYYIMEHEKQVNQAGYKGMYIRRWYR